MKYPIILCEDSPQQLKYLSETIKDYLLFHENQFELSFSSSDPYKIKDFVKENEIQKGIYFLDIDLSSNINGIDLAQWIRDNDVTSKIIFVTTHTEMAPLTLKRQVEALGFITKDEQDQMRDEIFENLKLAFQRMEQTTLEDENVNVYSFKVGNETLNFQEKEIILIESSDKAHRVILVSKNGQYEFFNNISKIEEETNFLKVSRSLLVNPQNIEKVDYRNRLIKFINGIERTFSISKVKTLKQRLQEK